MADKELGPGGELEAPPVDEVGLGPFAPFEAPPAFDDEPEPEPVFGDRVEFAEGVVAPLQIQGITNVDDGLAVEVTLRLPTDHDGKPMAHSRYVCVTLTCTSDAGVTGERLRGIPVAGIIESAVAQALGFNMWGYSSGPEGRDKSPAWRFNENYDFKVFDRPRRPPLPTGRRGPSDEMLRYVAYMYRVAVLIGNAPTEYVSQDLGIARATAGRWANRAREEGYLTAPAPRRPEIGKER